ncbi:hypothetical protein T01_15103 [Trichinella spiralis]|uniref:Uncharacterized protein n=1 Tax=Trichinella spiralis TaxID=6334 RepID=A0A0V1BYY3_TRISP|nr:hypothetical protein T01_15103 [Trichinella spiralis]
MKSTVRQSNIADQFVRWKVVNESLQRKHSSQLCEVLNVVNCIPSSLAGQHSNAFVIGDM